MKLTPTIVRQIDIPRMPKTVLLELLWLARGRPALVVSHDDLAARLGVSRKTITRAMMALREAGFIETVRTQRPRDGHRAADRITISSDGLTLVPVPKLRDKMSPKTGGACGPECPTALRDKMSQPIEVIYNTPNRDHESGRRDGDVQDAGAHSPEHANDGPNLRLVSGGKAA